MAAAEMLSPNFSLDELILSSTAVRAGIDNRPATPVILDNLRMLAGYLEDVRHELSDLPVLIDSAYRCPRVNQMVGGVKDSAHIMGLAADIICPRFGSPLEICRALAKSKIPFHQIIHEFGRWCHIGFAPKGVVPARELLTIADPRVGYVLGLRSVEGAKIA
jgi:hypothetical protein